MKILVLDNQQIRELMPMKVCIELMADALSALARGEVYQPLRTVVRPPEARGLLGLMPAYRTGERGAFGMKAICVFPENPARGKDAHQGAVMLFSRETGELMALMNASEITAIRTAAVSAVATRSLARSDAQRLAIIGAGVQARTHLLALDAVRSIKEVRVACRNIEHAAEFAREMQPRFSFTIEAVKTNEQAVRDADLIVTATSSHEPVINKDWISPGAHVNAIGTHSPTSREIDGATMASAKIFVDRRESALNESGDYLLAEKEGLVNAESIVAEIGELLIGTKAGRSSADEITLFKSLGLAIEDVACAELLYQRALSENRGTRVEL
ncbi:MAG TPA: ornithine cyclodeaminase family protein [Pyrinomonadaceae bacterium]|jgi:ornithine cyclodeaminase|nr:ornithine cyclodeaminase family protein [Pyrinomonadaceae bacterium]